MNMIQDQISPPRVMVVEDCPDQADFLARRLRALECEVEVAYSGLEALDILEIGQSGLRYPQIIVTDIKMPGVDGRELIRRLKSSDKHRHIPIIVLTATVDLDDGASLIQLGAASVCDKAAGWRDLLDALRVALRN